MAKSDSRGHDGDIVGIGGEILDERPVDLEGIDGKPFQIIQRRVALTEVIDGKANANGF